METRSWYHPATLAIDQIGTSPASARSAYCALAQIATHPIRSSSTNARVRMNSTAGAKGQNFSSGISILARLVLTLPEPGSVEDECRIPVFRDLASVRGRICSFTVNHDPIVITAGWRS